MLNIKTSKSIKCAFTPLKFKDCIKICSIDSENSCNYADCQYKCNQCKDKNVCYWIKEH